MRSCVALVCILGLAGINSGQAPTPDGGVGVYRNVIKATVWIHVTHNGHQITGSGSLIDRRRRLVLTNYHVVGNADRVTVYFPKFDNRKLVTERRAYLAKDAHLGIPARVLARDRKADLAIVQIEGVPDGAQAVLIADKSVSPGQSVHSIGNPGDSGALWIYTPGKVRQTYLKKWKAKMGDEVGSFEAHVIETDSATNAGDSGGPLVNDQGELVGVCHGADTEARLLSTFIDVSEAKQLLKTAEVRRIPARGRANPMAVDDKGKYFSTPAISKANALIREIEHRFGRDILVVTLDAATDGNEKLEKLRAMSAKEREEFFRDYLKAKLKEERINGMAVLACRDPRYVYVDVTSDARSVINDPTWKKVRETLLKQFRDSKFDDGLLESLKIVRDHLEELDP